jgi:PIN domain nuclease of toxin-antitoxin system
MNQIVLDASALLAVLKQEPGAATAAHLVSGALISAVNIAECVSVLVRSGVSPNGAREILDFANVRVEAFDRDLAERTGALIASTKHAGLSLGDRACLALALRENLPVLTADHAWKDVAVGAEVRFIR